MLKRIFLLAVVLFTFGCSGGHHKPTPHKIALSFIGYSLPNAWHLVDPTAFAAALADNGLTATQIDWTPYIQSPPVCNGSTNATYPDRAQSLVTAMRKRGITVFINIANFNGCATTNLPDSWMQIQINSIASLGTDHVAVIPVAEPWAAFNKGSKALAWTQIARKTWQGLFVIPDKGQNHHTKTPMWNIASDFLDVHYCSSAELQTALATGDAKSIANTDCGTILNPGVVNAAAFTRIAVEHKTNLLIYDFKASTPDISVIDAMGAEIDK